MLCNVFNNVLEWFYDKKNYYETISELNRLSPRELADIGLNQCDIYRLIHDKNN